MNSTVRIILIVIGIIALIGVIFFLFLSNKLEGLQGTSADKDYKILFNNRSDTIFVKASSWGLTGDHIQIQLSAFPMVNRNYDSAKNYIF